MSAPTPRLSLQGIHKRFHNVVAVRGVDLEVQAGEIVGLVGENGAGKSTLARIIGGICRPDAGQIRVDGEPCRIETVGQAQARGIAVVHQELNLVPHLTVEENIFLGREPFRVPLLRFTDRRELRRRAQQVLAYVGLAVPPATVLRTLGIASRQRVEIAKALSLEARLLVMDEPTSSLAAGEAAALLEILAALRAEGISVLYISHRLDEVLRICDRIAVLRDGEKVADRPAAATDSDALVTAMVGRELSTLFPGRRPAPGPVVLAVDRLVATGLRKPVSLQVRAGEVVGVAGLVGAGRSELLQAIFGASRREAGTVCVAGRVVPARPWAAMAAGLGLVPEDRKAQGLILPMGVQDNITLAVLRRLASAGFRRPRAEQTLAARYLQRLGIVAASATQPVARLSGGNQQKTLLAKWLAIEPRVLIMDEPTRGIDIAAKHEVYRLIASIAQEGVGVLMVSSEMGEIIGLCDRAIVMNEGAVAGELAGEGLTEEAIMRLAAQTESE